MNGASILGNSLKQLWSAYEKQLEKRPVLTQMTTSFVLWGTGDLIAQRLERSERQRERVQQQQQRGKKLAVVPPPPPGSSAVSTAGNEAADSDTIDLHRAIFTALFGAVFVGPVGHVWYQGIDNWCKRLVPKGGPAFIAAKVAIDTAVMGPLYVAAFFAWGCALIDYRGWPEFQRKMRVDFLPTLAAEVSVWPFVQCVNFSVVPIKHQLLVINVFTIMDAAFMSWARNKEDWVTQVLTALQPGSSSKGQLQMQPLATAGSPSKGSKSG